MQSIKARVLTVFMSFVMAVSMLPAINSSAAVSYKCGEDVHYTIENGTVTISGTGPMYNYLAYDKDGDKKPDLSDSPFYSKRTQFQKVVIEDGVTHVGNNAFLWCTGLKEVEFRSKGSLKTIGTQAFYECSLTKLALPYGLTSVGMDAFMANHYLVSLSIPNTVKTIGYGAFADCWELLYVYVPASVSTIGDFAFRGNHKLRSVTGGAGLTSIGVQAFEHTWNLKTFKITSKKLQRIGKLCFYCSGLKTLQIKKTTKLKKKKVKGSLYMSSVKTVKVKKSKVRKYKKFFTPRNCGKYRVKVKK